MAYQFFFTVFFLRMELSIIYRFGDSYEKLNKKCRFYVWKKRLLLNEILNVACVEIHVVLNAKPFFFVQMRSDGFRLFLTNKITSENTKNYLLQ